MDAARTAWGEYETRAVVEALDLDTELARWAGVGTAHELGVPQTQDDR